MIEIENHLGLVRLCANRFTGKGIEYDDLYGAGCIGLVKAAKSFEEERGLKFSTYDVPLILG
jgi:RNA polymerase sporulation-specific sigma factor